MYVYIKNGKINFKNSINGYVQGREEMVQERQDEAKLLWFGLEVYMHFSQIYIKCQKDFQIYFINLKAKP